MDFYSFFRQSIKIFWCHRRATRPLKIESYFFFSYPDVMMKSYHSSHWSAAFFISYLAINLYFLMNLMLAVVYDTFTKIEKEKFRRLYLHKRKAAQHAFKLLVTKERPEEVSFQHFEGLLGAFKPSACNIILLFCRLCGLFVESLSFLFLQPRRRPIWYSNPLTNRTQDIWIRKSFMVSRIKWFPFNFLWSNSFSTLFMM